MNVKPNPAANFVVGKEGSSVSGALSRIFRSLLICYIALPIAGTAPAITTPHQTSRQSASKKPAKPSAGTVGTLKVKIAFERGGDIWGLVTGNRERRLIPNGRSPSWSWDGRKLAFLRGQSIWIASLDNLNAPRKLCALSGPGSKPGDHGDALEITFSWHPTLSLLAYSEFEEFVLKRKGAQASEEGSQITLGSIQTVSMQRPAKGKEIEVSRLLPAHMRGWDNLGILNVAYPSWSPNGKHLAFVRGGNLWLATPTPQREFGRLRWDWYEAGIVLMVSDGGGTSGSDVMGCGHITWRPDGKAVAYEVRRWNGGSTFWIETVPIREEGKVTPKDVTMGRHPSYAPDGKRLIYVDFVGQSGPRVYILNLKTKRSELLINNGDFPVCNPNLKAWQP